LKHKIKNKLSKQLNKVAGFLKNNGIEAYWWNTKPIFGEQFTVEFLKTYGLMTMYTKFNENKMISDGLKFNEHDTSINHDTTPSQLNEESTFASVINSITHREIDKNVYDGLDEMLMKFSKSVLKSCK
jgi:hypothetical protein